MAKKQERNRLEAETDFALTLLTLTSQPENSLLSPVSIGFALSLVYAGGDKTVREEISNVVRPGNEKDDVIEHYSTLLDEFRRVELSDKVQLALGNRFYAQNNILISDKYRSLIREKLDADTENVDFSDARTLAVGYVGVLVNALYFKADWRLKFKQSLTEEMTFHNDHKANFMVALKTRSLYASDGLWEVLSLPYYDEDFALSIFLPTSRDLKQSIKDFNAQKLHSLLDARQKRLVDIYIPKFKIEQQLALKDVLSSMSCGSMFNLHHLEDISPGFFVSSIVHKAVIEVDEEGSTAAASTAVLLRCKRAAAVIPEDLIEFRADHPFLFVLSFKSHPLFTGLFCQP